MVEPKQGAGAPEVAPAAAGADGGHAGGPAGHAPDDGGRRDLLRGLIAAGGLLYAGALAAPAVSFATAPVGAKASGKERWVRVGRLADLAQGPPVRLSVVGDRRDAFTVTRDEVLGSVWLRRDGEQVTALSATCPHLGCSIDLAGDGASYGCPCHTSRFALAGAALSGPSPRGMDALGARVVDGWIEVDFRRFRVGVTDRREVGS